MKRSQRTEWNVFCSDATLILRPTDHPNGDPGTEWAEECAKRYGRLPRTCDPFDPAAAAQIAQWLEEHEIRWLNVAGPAEEIVPGIEEQTRRLFVQILSRIGRTP